MSRYKGKVPDRFVYDWKATSVGIVHEGLYGRSDEEKEHILDTVIRHKKKVLRTQYLERRRLRRALKKSRKGLR